jgi:tetratricopeptide (TPR) repeat protein
MPSHIYLKTGYYQKGVEVNINAVNSYKTSIPLYAPVTGADFLYIIHNLHMKTNNAMLMGNEKITLAAAAETQESIPVDYLSIPGAMGSLVQYVYHVPVLAQVRFAKWEALLQMKQPAKEQVYANILVAFGKGMALANTGKLSDAKTQLQAMQEWMKDSVLQIPFTPFSPAIDGAVTAEHLLKGTIALKENKTEEAITTFKIAVTKEENMVYNEPRDWLLNPKHYYGDALLKAKKGKEAQTVFEKDLLNNAENGWALTGLYQSLLLQKKTKEAAGVKARMQKALAKADVKLHGAVF